VKIEKLKIYIEKLELQKFEQAKNENYEKAKNLKDEIDRIKNVVLSITSGSSKAKPKIIPPMVNAQQRMTLTSSKKSVPEIPAQGRTLASYENFKVNQESYESNNNPYGYPDAEAIGIRKLSYAGNVNAAYRKSGILKMKESQNASQLDQSVSSKNNPSGVNSTLNLSYHEEFDEYDDPYSTSNKKHVRILDPKNMML